MSVIRIVIGDMTQVYAEVEGCVSDQRVRGNSFSIPVLIQYSKMFFFTPQIESNTEIPLQTERKLLGKQ